MSEEWESRPLPEVNPETEPFWAAAADGEFRLKECRDCGLVYYYPRERCPDCFGADTEWIIASGLGEVYSYSVSERMEGWPDEALPVVLAYVELDEGPRVMTNVVETDSDDLSVGDRVEVRFVPTADDDVSIPVFAPIEE